MESDDLHVNVNMHIDAADDRFVELRGQFTDNNSFAI